VPSSHDVLIVGGGVAGAAAGAFLAAAGVKSLLLEAENAPDLHSTGRSAALYSEYLGGPVVRALTAASGRFFADPPPGFTDHPVLTPRGMLALCPVGSEHLVDNAVAAGADVPHPARELAADEAMALCPALRPESFRRAVLRRGVAELDVAAVHRGLLGMGGELVCNARVHRLERDGSGWRAYTSAGEFVAGAVVNAAGAWADDVAALAGAAPQGLVPRRRTACVADVADEWDTRGWPCLIDLTETFYLRPEPGAALVSPMDATPMPAGHVRADDADVARGLDAAREFVTLPLRRVRRTWAGLRTANAADVPLIGRDPNADGFFWLAGLGGHGIQISPAAGTLLAAAVTGDPIPAQLDGIGALTAQAITPFGPSD
jgi:D-arginine dehydrogenase